MMIIIRQSSQQLVPIGFFFFGWCWLAGWMRSAAPDSMNGCQSCDIVSTSHRGRPVSCKLILATTPITRRASQWDRWVFAICMCPHSTVQINRKYQIIMFFSMGQFQTAVLWWSGTYWWHLQIRTN